MPTLRLKTAIPKMRHQLGTFSTVILGDIDSQDGRTYRHILALVPDGADQPILYLTCYDLAQPTENGQSTVVEVIAETGTRTLGPNDRWRDREVFARDAIAMVQRIMGLEDEMPARLL